MSEGIPFGRYRLMYLLGEGGMAKVYRAVLSGPMGFEKDVALKRLDPRLTADERMVRSLVNEARLGGQLRHKNIVEIYEFNSVQANYYMAMEYVDGWTLDAVLETARRRGVSLPPSVVVEILSSVCKGLHFAHTLESKDGTPLNLVHRDLKPANVIVSRDGDVKILDFGIAKADTNLYKTTAADVTKGTPVYMSPEQVTGAKLDARSDLFSLGSIMVELLTLDVPFKGGNLLAIMHAVLNADVESSLAQVSRTCPLMTPVVERSMAQDRDQRFSTALELEKALREVRRALAPGPTLAEWLEEVGEEILPEPRANDTWGPDGPPAPVVTTGEGSADVGSGDFDPLESAAARSMPGSQVSASPVGALAGGDLGGNQYADTIDVEGKKLPMGSMTADFFSTDGDSAARAVPQPIEVTRLQKALPKKRKRRKKRKTERSRLLLLPLIAGLLAVLFFLLLQSGDPGADVGETPAVVEPEPDAPVDPSGLELVEPTTEAAQPEPTPKPMPEAKPDPTPAPTPAPSPAPSPAPTPAPKPEPPREVPPEVEPAPVAMAGAGRLDANSKPWSNLYLDGAYIGQTPKIGLEVSAGVHKLDFHCGSCVPAEKKTVSFKVRDGETVKQIVRFGAE